MRAWTPPSLSYAGCAVALGLLLAACGRGSGAGASSGAQAAPRTAMPEWRPPAGVPMPSFGITEAAGEPTHVVSGGDALPQPVPAGAVVEIRGVHARNYTSPRGVQCAGTAERPAFIRGAPGAVVTGQWEISGRYCILENLKFSGPGGTFLAPGDHLVLRDSEVTGTPTSGGWGVQAWGADDLSHVVVMRTKIHDNGDWRATFDQDNHGIGVYRASAATGSVSQVWIVDNELWHNSGDGVQINGNQNDGRARMNHLYLARNVTHHNKQHGLWSKQASDVIFSENLAYAHRPSDSSYGAGMGFQYGPERVWFLFNHIHDCEFGITASSDQGSGDGVHSYYIGNVIHGIHASGAFNPNTGWANAGLMLAGGTHRWVLNNTIHDADGGIHSPGGGELHMANNLISGITQPQGAHVFVEMPQAAAASTLHHMLFSGPVRIKWGDARRSLDIQGLRAAFRGQCEACLGGDPGFVDPAGDDLRLRPTSPARDAGAALQVYATFAELYGVPIARDAAGTPRPQGKAWDIGAYEVPE